MFHVLCMANTADFINTVKVYGGPSVSRHFCFINIVFTLNAFHLEVNVNANTTHL